MNDPRVNDIHTSLVALKPWLADNPSTSTAFSADWLFLQDSEAKLILLMNGDKPPDSLPGDVEYGLILYLIQTVLPDTLGSVGTDIVDALEALGMPVTAITATEYGQWETTVEGAGVVASDGTFVSTVSFATFDPGWALAVVYYLMSRYADDLPSWLQWVATAPFATTPATVAIDDADTLKIAVISDWGTGPWSDGQSTFCPSQLVQRSVDGLKPDIVIHLGDVYYYGSSSQEQANLLDVWVAGPKGSFTLNSNHEMYDGATGYYSALSNPIFLAQNGTSYFAIAFKNWLIFGLDSAYYDRSVLFTAGTVSDADQLTFISSVLAAPGNAGKQIIVLTHHNALDYDGRSISTRSDGSLLNDVWRALGKRLPEFWYYGHIHNGVVYNDHSIAGLLYLKTFEQHPKFRCFGHGAMPFGAGYGFTQNNAARGLDYYAHTSMGTTDLQQQNRVLNGFALLTLEQGSIKEQAFEVANIDNGMSKITLKWEATTTF